MVHILSRIFIRNVEGEEQRKGYGTLCSILGIVLNILLFAGKYFAGVISGSVAITADAFNNLSDAGSSFITLIGFVFAGKEPDPEHPFGHGRFEYVSGFVVAGIILLMGYELFTGSIEKIIHPVAIDTSNVAIGILIVSILVKIYMAFYNYQVGKEIESSAMKATATDSLMDSIATTVVLASMLVMRLAGYNVDGICGVVVSLFIFYAGYNAAKETLDPLLGNAPDKEFVEQIESIVMAHEGICGIHDLVVHDYGPGRKMISLHAEVPGDGDIFELHDLIDCIERELKQKLYCETVIHMDPIETDNEEVKRIRAIVAEQIKDIHKDITIHDFRMVTGPTHTNLIFDAVKPYDMKMSDEELRKSIEVLVEEIEGEQYFAVVEIDQSYV